MKKRNTEICLSFTTTSKIQDIDSDENLNTDVGEVSEGEKTHKSTPVPLIDTEMSEIERLEVLSV